MALDSGYRPTNNRSLTNLERGIAYPSPFFDVSSTYLPRSVKSLFRWCQYYFWTNPLVAAVIGKLAEYPITDLVLESSEKSVKERWDWLLQDQLQYRSFEVGVGIDFQCLGNSYTSVAFPFRKILYCGHCGQGTDADDNRRRWRYTGERFFLHCKHCGQSGRATADDHYLKSASGIRLIRWDPMDIDVRYLEQSGKKEYYYTPPAYLKADILSGRREIVASTPQILLEATRLNRPVRLNPQNFFHLARNTVANPDRGTGVPVLFPVLKDLFYLRVLQKAQEALALTNIIPMRFLFPQPGGPLTDPVTTVNLSEWRGMLETELRKLRYDPGYVSLVPFPVGNQIVGGEGRALLLNQEIRVMAEFIIAGMGYPPSLVFGDVNWSGSSVALRMLENTFLGFIGQRRRLLNFVIKNIAAHLEWPLIDYHVKPFKMADDLPKRQLAMNLNQWGKISDRTLLAECDFDYDRELGLIQEEQATRLQTARRQSKVTAEAQGEAMVLQAAYQARAMAEQERVRQSIIASSTVNVPGAMGGPQGPEGTSFQSGFLGPAGGFDTRLAPQAAADQLTNMDPASRQLALQQMQAAQPELHMQVMRRLAPTPDIQALPEQRPPRRSAASAVI